MRRKTVKARCGFCGADFDARTDLKPAQHPRCCSRSCAVRLRMQKPLMSYVDQSGDPDACWPWLGYIERHGYGRYIRERVKQLAHRAVYEAAVGPIPEGLDILHSCDNPACCNPSHLRTGTHADNMADMVTRGRHRPGLLRGEQVGSAKLTEAHVKKIKLGLARGACCARLAERYGVSAGAIYDISAGRTWTHVAAPFAELQKEAA